MRSVLPGDPTPQHLRHKRYQNNDDVVVAAVAAVVAVVVVDFAVVAAAVVAVDFAPKGQTISKQRCQLLLLLLLS